MGFIPKAYWMIVIGHPHVNSEVCLSHHVIPNILFYAWGVSSSQLILWMCNVKQMGFPSWILFQREKKRARERERGCDSYRRVWMRMKSNRGNKSFSVLSFVPVIFFFPLFVCLQWIVVWLTHWSDWSSRPWLVQKEMLVFPPRPDPSTSHTLLSLKNNGQQITLLEQPRSHCTIVCSSLFPFQPHEQYSVALSVHIGSVTTVHWGPLQRPRKSYNPELRQPNSSTKSGQSNSSPAMTDRMSRKEWKPLPTTNIKLPDGRRPLTAE